jgi:two-component system chemotaxis response regulator CheY
MALSILLVDDSATVRGVIARAIRMTKIPIAEDIQEAANGAQALDILRNHWVDLIITDIHMPEMGGLEMIDRLRQDPVLSAIPVVIISTDGGMDRMTEARDKGVLGYLRKPFTPEQLKDLLVKALGKDHG